MDNNLLKLEFDRVLENLSSYCKTYIGKNYVSELRPSNDIDYVKETLNETSQGVILIQRNSTPPLDEIADISVYLKILDSNGILSIKALLEIQNILKTSANLKKYFNKDYLEDESFEFIKPYFEDLYTNPSIVSTLSKSIIDENTIADSASSKLQDIRRKKRKIEQDIRAKLNSILHSSAYSKYIQESLVTIRNNRFVIPVKEEYRSNIKGFIHDISSSGSTVFVEPISVFELNNEISNLNIEEELEIDRILQNLSGLLYPYTSELESNVNLIGKLDFIFAKASYSLKLHCTTPIVSTEKVIELKNAKHPLINQELVVPISIKLGKDFSNLVITGPNAGGKTVTLKTVGLLTAMACSGLNIPANENSNIYVFDNIFADIGDEQSISESLSTFSAHISNIVKIIHKATENSLILLDELGSGTDPLEGANLAISILQYFAELGAITVSTSHYQELKKYALVTPNFKNASVEFDIESLKPTYRLLIGIPGKSNAFAISRKLGLNENIIKNASSMMDKNIVNFEDLLKNIYDEKIKIENEKKKIDFTLREVEELKKNIKTQNSDIIAKEKNLINSAKSEAKQILLDAKETANELIKNINFTNSASEANKIRNNLNEKITSLNTSTDTQNEPEKSTTIPREDIKPNMNVFVSNLNSDGVILSNISKDDTVQIQVGAIKMKVNIKYLQPVHTKAKKKDFSYTKNSSKSQFVKPELNVIGLTVDEAIPIIDKYLDDCLIAKLYTIRIVHGKGTGALRKGIHSYLKTNKIVDSYRLGTFGEGEMGVTIVTLKETTL